MTRYWDLTIRQRAELTDDQLQKLQLVELMENGIAPAMEPVLQPVPDVEPPSVKAWQVGTVLFTDPASADAFVALRPMTTEYDWKLGYENKVLRPVDTTVTQVMVYDDQTMERNRQAMQEARSAKDANEKALAAYAKACKENADAVSNLLADYTECRTKQAAAQQVVRTYDDYVQLADGDELTAAKFLQSTYKDMDLAHAFELTGRTWPFPMAEPEPQVDDPAPPVDDDVEAPF